MHQYLPTELHPGLNCLFKWIIYNYFLSLFSYFLLFYNILLVYKLCITMVLLQPVYSLFQPYLCSLPFLFLVPYFTPANPPPQPSLLTFMVFLCVTQWVSLGVPTDIGEFVTWDYTLFPNKHYILMERRKPLLLLWPGEDGFDLMQVLSGTINSRL